MRPGQVAGVCVGATHAAEVTTSVVHRHEWVEVARVDQGATRRFKRIAHAVAVHVAQAHALAIVPFFRVDAFRRVDRFRIVVAGRARKAS